MKEEILVATNEDKIQGKKYIPEFSDKPFVKIPLRCKIIHHDFFDLETELIVTTISGIKACKRCGRVYYFHSSLNDNSEFLIGYGNPVKNGNWISGIQKL
jgi:hypothetical protein